MKSKEDIYEMEETNETMEDTKRTVDESHMPDNLSWDEIIPNADIIECPNCSHAISLESSIITVINEGILTRSSEYFFQYGRNIYGIALSFLIAVLVGTIVAFVINQAATWIGILAALVFLVLRPILIPAFYSKASFYYLECNSCNRFIILASDGKMVQKANKVIS